MELQRLFGVTTVGVYDDVVDNATLDIIRHYDDEGFVGNLSAKFFANVAALTHIKRLFEATLAQLWRVRSTVRSISTSTA